ncbi:hypothetical protein [Actinokineospora globicatena]|uniref:hypothetical protein n=1 Tax=Actinokineospora globicatena TaxID=103729 RepID=UPI0020A4E2F6|nr:hypothetical protein [Actinokineospora globicatena]MCP2302540.1 hypothetical protein [Actinokineospora globicatena]GLW75773.1 hypothetical protein Aglo01_02550 [Actinokineospora globicatena]GLW82613.1 hypothetical protein Aglo02_02540 [Actinokineospora globicatena]
MSTEDAVESGKLARFAGLAGVVRQTDRLGAVGARGQSPSARRRGRSRLAELTRAAVSFDWVGPAVHVAGDLVAASTPTVDWDRGSVTSVVHTHIAAVERHGPDNALAGSSSRARDLVAEHTDGGRRPALVIAPFHPEDTNPGSTGIAVALRRAWTASPWHDDLALVPRLVQRPLRDFDTDVWTIRGALSGLPVVLLYGRTEGDRVVPALAAWNLLPQSPSTVLDTTFPAFDLPGSNDWAGRLRLGDHLGRMFALTAGNLGDWFHLLTHDRAPHLHRLVPPDHVPERRILATSAADAHDVLVTRTSLGEHRTHVRQARLLAEGGLPDIAGSAAQAVLTEITRSTDLSVTERVVLLRELVGVFGLIGADDHLLTTERLLHTASITRV